MKRILKKEIKRVLEDVTFLQPDMIIEEKEPFFWRMNPDWVKRKTEEIYFAVINILATTKK